VFKIKRVQALRPAEEFDGEKVLSRGKKQTLNEGHGFTGCGKTQRMKTATRREDESLRKGTGSAVPQNLQARRGFSR
jgi:hypothetical protein